MTEPRDIELAETVARMEARLAADATEALAVAYAQVSARFAADLDDPRDVLLSRGGALMLAQALLDRTESG